MNQKNTKSKGSNLVKISLLLSALSLFGILALLAFQFSSEPKMAYIQSDILLDKYKGMVEAREGFKVKADSWQANIDTLKVEFETSMKAFEKELASLNKAERAKKEQALRKKQEDLMRYTDAISKQAEQEDQKITQGVLTQVNSFIEVYGKNEGYDVIFGANGSGNIVYGTETIDITNEVLMALNKDYEGR